MSEEKLETVKCSICHEPFERDVNRKEGRLISCPAHSFGDVELEDYDPHTPKRPVSKSK